jgi:UDP-3-O-[3-hydroxymyristoyl] glucosamine N-acyltransferase
MESRGAQFVNLIHPSALIAPDAQLGTGIFIFIHSVISAGVHVEDFATLNAFVLLGHDAIIGRGCTLCPAAMLTGNVKLGRGVLMATHTSVAPQSEVGAFATIGMGSAVISTAPEGVTMMGVPARVISQSRGWPISRTPGEEEPSPRQEQPVDSGSSPQRLTRQPDGTPSV